MKISLRPSPDFFDLDGWKQRLKDLESDDPDTVAHDIAIDHAKTMVELISDNPKKSPTEAP